MDETLSPPESMGPVGSAAQETGNLDSDGHGTAVAGVIGAVTNNTLGLASLGWNTHVLPVKVDFSANNASAQIESGIEWAADNGAKVINLSFGGVCPDSSILTGIQYAQSKGALVVASAGNGAIYPQLDTLNGQDDVPSYPAADSGVMAVGATGKDGFRAAYSTDGSYLSLVAPGGSAIPGSPAEDVPLLAPTNACTPMPGDGCYTTGAGTSFASPEVAATAALILSVNPTLSPTQVAQLITGSADDIGPTGFDIEYGYGMLDPGVALSDTPPVTPGYGTYFSLPPARILDTRFGIGAPVGKLGPGASLPLQVTGSGGVPASGVAAVVMNTTVTNATAQSFLTVWPTGQTRPNSSNLNFRAGQTVPNLVTVKVGANGQVSFYNLSGSTDVLADVAGYYVDGSGAAGSTFVPLPPTRIMDTRQSGGPIAAQTSRDLQVVGGAVPAGATGIVVNVTAASPTQQGYLTVYPTGESPPNASNLNFRPNQNVPNLVSVQIGTGGTVSFFNSAGSVQVIADLQGYFTSAGDSSGSRYFPLINHRILDTRSNVGGFYGPIGTNQQDAVSVVGQGGVLSGATSAVMNSTVTSPTATGFLTVYPDGATLPNSSNLNFIPNLTVANLVTAKIGSDGKDDFYNSAGTSHAIADVVGYYGAPGA
jgi:hypothetical protein